MWSRRPSETRSDGLGLLRRLVGRRAKDAGGRRKAARCAIGDLDLIFPWQAECARDHVLHEGVRAIHRAALHRDVTTVPELIDIVLDAPVDPRFADEIGAYLRGDDLVGSPGGAMGDHAAV